MAENTDGLNSPEISDDALAIESSTSSMSSSISASSSAPDSPATSSNSPPAKKPKKKMEVPAPLRSDWDPTKSSAGLSTGSISFVATTRIKRDIQEFTNSPPVGIYALTRDSDMTKIDILIVGPEGTPYQGGFFHFYVSFGNDYPFQPPRVKLMTTDHGKVRFNPNFYNNGKICLSILHTWNGPQWTASQNLTSLMCSIQSLMTEEPYRNEPGHEKMKASSREAKDYLDIIRHETLRVAVVDTILGNTTCPKPLIDNVAKPEFLRQYDYYRRTAISGRGKTDLHDFLGGCRGPFDFESLENKLQDIKSGMDSTASTSSVPVRTTRCIELGDRQVIGNLKLSESVREVEEKKKAEERKAGIDDDWDFSAISDDSNSDLSEYEEDGDVEAGDTEPDPEKPDPDLPGTSVSSS